MRSTISRVLEQRGYTVLVAQERSSHGGAPVNGVYIKKHCAEELGLSQVRFLHRDARQVDYADGTVFFMYTPFTGKLLAAVLATLARQARHRSITLCTYGACTFEVARQAWLRLSHPETEHIYTLAVFKSL